MNGHTTIRTEVLQDSRLSYQARGVLCHMAIDAYPKVSPDVLDQLSEELGEQEFLEALEELESVGYVTVSRYGIFAEVFVDRIVNSW